MAALSDDPKGWELEDLVAAHFAARGCFVETGITERNPDELLELDIVWTDYRKDPPTATPVEVKSGQCGLGDLFKFFGWTRYLGLPAGQFIHKQPFGRVDAATLDHVCKGTGIELLEMASPIEAESKFKVLGLPEPPAEFLPELWRYSFWAQRKLLRSLGKAIEGSVCRNSAIAAKGYHHLLNDALFFLPDHRDRIAALLAAHFNHQHLGLSAAHEIETGKVDLIAPPQSVAFKRAYYSGKSYPIQACLYLAHRARLSVMKALVDYWLARERGEITPVHWKIGDQLFDVTEGQLSAAMRNGIEEMSKATAFRLFPTLWQTFLCTWGGFLLKDRLADEYSALSSETGVPVEEIPLALSAFDKLFPVNGGWFREPSDDTRRCLILMPASLRGIGAVRRKLMKGVSEYADLGLRDSTAGRIASDHNDAAFLLDVPDEALAK